MIDLLVTLLIIVLILGICVWAIGLIPLPAPFAQAAQIILALICIGLLFGMLFGYAPPLRFR